MLHVIHEPCSHRTGTSGTAPCQLVMFCPNISLNVVCSLRHMLALTSLRPCYVNRQALFQHGRNRKHEHGSFFDCYAHQGVIWSSQVIGTLLFCFDCGSVGSACAYHLCGSSQRRICPSECRKSVSLNGRQSSRLAVSEHLVPEPHKARVRTEFALSELWVPARAFDASIHKGGSCPSCPAKPSGCQ